MYDRSYYGRSAPRDYVPRVLAVQLAQERDQALEEVEHLRAALKQREVRLEEARAVRIELERRLESERMARVELERHVKHEPNRRAELERALRDALARVEAAQLAGVPATAAPLVTATPQPRGEAMRGFLALRDNLERALVLSDAPNNPWHIGLEGLLKQLDQLLEEQELSRFGKVGERFDPRIHEAIGVDEREGVAPGELLEVARPGFVCATTGQLVRAAQVVVSRLSTPVDEGDAGPEASEHDAEGGDAEDGLGDEPSCEEE